MKILFFVILFILLFTISSSQKISFGKLLSFIQATKEKKLIAVAGGDSEEVLKALRKVKDLDIADSILIGDEQKIIIKATSLNLNISDFQIINIQDEVEIARTAVKLVHDGKADMYMKGSIQSSNYLKAILDPKIGLRTDKALSGVVVMDVPTLSKTIFITDGAVNINMDFDIKVKVIENVIDVAHACGIQIPKVAALTAIDYVDNSMIETVEADKLSKMQDNNEIKGCIIDGPIPLDLAVVPDIANKTHGMSRKINGDADVLLFPDIHSGNIGYKVIGHTTKCENGNLLVGTSRPCIFTSRSDGEEVKINSIILATIYADYLKRKEKDEQIMKEIEKEKEQKKNG